IPELADLSSDQLNRGLETRVVIDRDTASRLGVSPQASDDTLYDAFGQRQVSTMYLAMNQRHVVMEVQPEFQRTPDALKSLYVRSSTGANIPLAAFTRVETAATTLSVNHQGQYPAVTL